MKNISLIALLFALFFVACKKEDRNQISSDVSLSKTLSLKAGVNTPVSNQDTLTPEIRASLETLADVPLETMGSMNEMQKAVVNANIVSNSVNKLKTEYGFTDAEIITQFGSLTSNDIGIFGAVLSILEKLPKDSITSNGWCDSQYKIVSCAISAIGAPCTTINVVARALSGWLMKTPTTVTRYEAASMIRELIGLGINVATGLTGFGVIYSFSLCMILPQGAPVDYPDTGGGNNDGNNDSGIPPLSFDNLNTSYMYGESYPRLERILNLHEPAHSTYIYKSGNKYYYNSQKTCLLPSGYYLSSNNKYYKVSNGNVVEIGIINPCSSCPVEVLPPIVDPFTPCN
ncbi:MAG: hypothetical protein ACN6O7_12765 [Sphingobacterium sp.]